MPPVRDSSHSSFLPLGWPLVPEPLVEAQPLEAGMHRPRIEPAQVGVADDRAPHHPGALEHLDVATERVERALSRAHLLPIPTPVPFECLLG